MTITDTERLDFILKYLRIDDIGDETALPGVCCNSEKLEHELTYDKRTNTSNIETWDDDLRDVIDRVIRNKHYNI